MTMMTPLAGGFLALDNAETWVLVAFFLFIGLLIYVGAFKFIGKALDDRAAGIRRQLNEARDLKEEAQAKLAEFERKSQEVSRQADEIVERAKREADAAFEQAKQSIADSVAQKLKNAEEQIALAEADAVRAVRNTAVDAAVAASADVLKKSVGASSGAMIDDAISEVSKRLN